MYVWRNDYVLITDIIYQTAEEYTIAFMKNTWQSSVYPDPYPDVATVVSIEQEEFKYLFDRSSWVSSVSIHVVELDLSWTVHDQSHYIIMASIFMFAATWLLARSWGKPPWNNSNCAL